jgi:hypothetical protein
MPPTLTAAPDPTVFPADVLAFAAERGVTGYLAPLYELTRQCFPGAEITVTQQNDYEVAGLGWVVYEVAVRDWGLDRYRAARDRWMEGFIAVCPSDASENFALGLR